MASLDIPFSDLPFLSHLERIAIDWKHKCRVGKGASIEIGCCRFRYIFEC